MPLLVNLFLYKLLFRTNTALAFFVFCSLVGLQLQVISFTVTFILVGYVFDKLFGRPVLTYERINFY